jgi:carbamoyl-phosphate synthase large subunit
MAAEDGDSFNVLISSAGRRVALLDIFRRTLREMDLCGDVVATDVSKLSSAFHSADRSFLVPACSSAEFIPEVLEVCRRNQVRLLVPTTDRELPVFAENRDRFREAGTTVAVSSPRVVSMAADKVETHRWLASEGFPTVRQATVQEVLAEPKRWPFPLVVKPRKGSASIGLAVVHDLPALQVAASGGDFVVQAMARGDEYTIDVLVDGSGASLGAVPRRRIEVRAGESSKGITVRSEDLIDLARRLAEALPGAYGALTIQVFDDPASGETNVIEINPRFAGGFPLSWEAGAKFPQRMIEEILGIEPRTPADEWRDGLVMLRYDEGVFVDARTAGVMIGG